MKTSQKQIKEVYRVPPKSETEDKEQWNVPKGHRFQPVSDPSTRDYETPAELKHEPYRQPPGEQTKGDIPSRKDAAFNQQKHQTQDISRDKTVVASRNQGQPIPIEKRVDELEADVERIQSEIDSLGGVKKEELKSKEGKTMKITKEQLTEIVEEALKEIGGPSIKPPWQRGGQSVQGSDVQKHIQQQKGPGQQRISPMAGVQGSDVQAAVDQERERRIKSSGGRDRATAAGTIGEGETQNEELSAWDKIQTERKKKLQIQKDTKGKKIAQPGPGKPTGSGFKITKEYLTKIISEILSEGGKKEHSDWLAGKIKEREEGKKLDNPSSESEHEEEEEEEEEEELTEGKTMKITKEGLIKLIREELEKMIPEEKQVSPGVQPAGGEEDFGENEHDATLEEADSVTDELRSGSNTRETETYSEVPPRTLQENKKKSVLLAKPKSKK